MNFFLICYPRAVMTVKKEFCNALDIKNTKMCQSHFHNYKKKPEPVVFKEWFFLHNKVKCADLCVDLIAAMDNTKDAVSKHVEFGACG